MNFALAPATVALVDRLMRGPDFREGFAAFTGRRPPRFQGAPE
jgi:hypothetical protein